VVHTKFRSGIHKTWKGNGFSGGISSSSLPGRFLRTKIKTGAFDGTVRLIA